MEASPTCSCFGWCDAAQADAFFRALPPVVTSEASPWHAIAANVYHAKALRLPLALAEFGVFKMPRDGGDVRLPFDTECPVQPQPCASSACRPFVTAEMRPPDLVLTSRPRRPARARGDGALPLAPWAWNRSQRVAHGAQTVEHHVQQVIYRWLTGPSYRFKLQWVHSWGRARVPAQIMIWRAARDPVAAPNHSWVEAFRVNHPTQREGVDGYGCMPLGPRT